MWRMEGSFLDSGSMRVLCFVDRVYKEWMVIIDNVFVAAGNNA